MTVVVVALVVAGIVLFVVATKVVGVVLLSLQYIVVADAIDVVADVIFNGIAAVVVQCGTVTVSQTLRAKVASGHRNPGWLNFTCTRQKHTHHASKQR